MSQSASKTDADKKRAAPKSAWKPGQSGNPNGRAAVPPEVRDALQADTLARYQRLKKLSADAESAGDLKTAAHIELALLKKTIPDATELVVSMPEGLNVRSVSIDPKKLTKEQLEVIQAAIATATKEGA